MTVRLETILGLHWMSGVLVTVIDLGSFCTVLIHIHFCNISLEPFRSNCTKRKKCLNLK